MIHHSKLLLKKATIRNKALVAGGNGTKKGMLGSKEYMGTTKHRSVNNKNKPSAIIHFLRTLKEKLYGKCICFTTIV